MAANLQKFYVEAVCSDGRKYSFNTVSAKNYQRHRLLIAIVNSARMDFEKLDRLHGCVFRMKIIFSGQTDEISYEASNFCFPAFLLS